MQAHSTVIQYRELFLDKWCWSRNCCFGKVNNLTLLFYSPTPLRSSITAETFYIPCSFHWNHATFIISKYKVEEARVKQ